MHKITSHRQWSLQAGSIRGAHWTHWFCALLLGTSEDASLAGSLICSGTVVRCIINHFWQPSCDGGYAALPLPALGDTQVPITPAVRAGAQGGAVLRKAPSRFAPQPGREVCPAACRRVLSTPGRWETMVLARLVLNSSAPISSVSSSGPCSSLSTAWSPQPAWRASPRHLLHGWTSTAPSQRFGQVGDTAPVCGTLKKPGWPTGMD